MNWHSFGVILVFGGAFVLFFAAFIYACTRDLKMMMVDAGFMEDDGEFEWADIEEKR